MSESCWRKEDAKVGEGWVVEKGEVEVEVGEDREGMQK
jgi:hypothetical protein